MPTYTLGNTNGSTFGDTGTTAAGTTGGVNSLSLALAQANADASGHGTAAYNVDLLAAYAQAPSLVGQPVADPTLAG